MSSPTQERRGRGLRRPPSRLGRLLVALRQSVGVRSIALRAHPSFLNKVAQHRHRGLTREEAAAWVSDITDKTIEPETIRRIEVGAKVRPKAELLRPLLTSYGLEPDEIDEVVRDPHLNSIGGANPHLLAAWRMRSLAFGEFGPVIGDALKIGKYVSTWVEVEKAEVGGYRPGDVRLHVTNETTPRPPAFTKLADDVLRQNEVAKANGARGWSNNRTLCLSGVVSEIADDDKEHPIITLQLEPSFYKYNVIAKQEAGAEFRWQALQNAEHPLRPVPFLASGVGICINVICDGGASIVLGQRSNQETFRKGEFDIAVVEGIRPQSDVHAGQIDIRTVARRALKEELGVALPEELHGAPDPVKHLAVFEFGCDLEFYQWNFLSFAELDLSFDEIYERWQGAKDRKENQTLRAFPFDREELLNFVQTRPFWSAGAACCLRTFDHYKS